ncbi:MAG: hypothetical protein PWP24_664 [Clostridiales bacterium]|nr:hypothetical protein [Clostridiales bacterium]
MEKNEYFISLQTQIGERKGKMRFVFDEMNVIGELEILNCRNSFIGKRQKNGTYKLNGSITTLVGEMQYEAEGIIQDEYLSFTLTEGEHEYRIHGTKDIKRSKENEEIL